MMNGPAEQQDGNDTLASQCRDEEIGGEDHLHSSNEVVTSNVEIASSPMGEVKNSLSCSSVLRGLDFRLPSCDQLLKMEDKCLLSYKL